MIAAIFLIFALPLDISDAGCPSQTIDLIGEQIVCVEAQEPPAPPAPPLPGAACPVQPSLSPQPAGPYWFTGCGENTHLQTREPTKVPHAYSDGVITNRSICSMPGTFQGWPYRGGDVTVVGHDSRIVLNDTVGGNFIVTGDNIQIRTINGHHIQGDVVCQGASNVELNGVCVCP